MVRTAFPRNTKIGNLANTRGIDEDVVSFHVAMDDFVVVEIGKAFQDLRGEGLNDRFVEFAMFPQTTSNRSSRNVLKKPKCKGSAWRNDL